jgi:hypothetical protein
MLYALMTILCLIAMAANIPGMFFGHWWAFCSGLFCAAGAGYCAALGMASRKL